MLTLNIVFETYSSSLLINQFFFSRERQAEEMSRLGRFQGLCLQLGSQLDCTLPHINELITDDYTTKGSVTGEGVSPCYAELTSDK